METAIQIHLPVLDILQRLLLPLFISIHIEKVTLISTIVLFLNGSNNIDHKNPSNNLH